jgi:hypothetical protein
MIRKGDEKTHLPFLFSVARISPRRNDSKRLNEDG